MAVALFSSVLENCRDKNPQLFGAMLSTQLFRGEVFSYSPSKNVFQTSSLNFPNWPPVAIMPHFTVRLNDLKGVFKSIFFYDVTSHHY